MNENVRRRREIIPCIGLEELQNCLCDAIFQLKKQDMSQHYTSVELDSREIDMGISAVEATCPSTAYNMQLSHIRGNV